LSIEPSYVGFIVEVKSYTEARALVLARETSLLRYGALALVTEGGEEGKRYLAMVMDVSERSLTPSINTEALSNAYRLTSQASYEEAEKVLRLLFSPTESLVKWQGIRELHLKILGELSERGLELPTRPPRPTARVEEPEAGLLQRLLSKGLEGRGIYVGTLYYNPKVKVYLDPDRLSMHLAIVGQTGSGKTETVKRIVAEYAWRKREFSDSGGIVVFDIAGEYTGYPYTQPDTYPLLEAILNYREFYNGEAPWLSTAKKTILVPYDIATISTYKESEINYARREIGSFIMKLNERYLGGGYQVKGLVFARHGIYLVESDKVIHVSRVSRGKAIELIYTEPILVVATPLPDSLDLETIVELSGTKSEYFEPAITEVADRARLLSIGTIESISLLQDVISIARAAKDANKTATIEGSIQNIIKNIAEQRKLYKSAYGICDDLENMLKNILGDRTPYIHCASWLYYLARPVLQGRHGILSEAEKPTASELSLIASEYDLSVENIIEALNMSDGETGKRWGESIAGAIASAMRALYSYHEQTIASVARGLGVVVRSVSPQLDRLLYRVLAERVIDGFTIVHLAPPSKGDTDYIVTRLLNEVFEASVERYSWGRRSLIVVEEAHNLAPPGLEKASGRALLRLSREGRKWGLGLILVSQRPGFVDPSVMSQTATLVALRVTNPDDIAGLRRGAESASQEFIERLSDLEQGQAVIAGIAVPERRVPLVVKVEKLKPLNPAA